MAKAVFFLVAVVILVSVFSTAIFLGACLWKAGAELYETCGGFKARDFIVELLATALVLLNIRPPPPKD
jgi:hypothetical protein